MEGFRLLSDGAVSCGEQRGGRGTGRLMQSAGNYG